MKKGETGLTREELETVINFDESPQMATVYSINTKMLKRLREIKDRDPEKRVFLKEDSLGFEWWKVDKGLVTLRLPMTEEGRAHLRQVALQNNTAGRLAASTDKEGVID